MKLNIRQVTALQEFLDTKVEEWKLENFTEEQHSALEYIDENAPCDPEFEDDFSQALVEFGNGDWPRSSWGYDSEGNWKGDALYNADTGELKEGN